MCIPINCVCVHVYIHTQSLFSHLQNTVILKIKSNNVKLRAMNRPGNKVSAHLNTSFLFISLSSVISFTRDYGKGELSQYGLKYLSEIMSLIKTI